MVLALMYDPAHTFAYIWYRFEPGSKAGALVEATPCSLDHHGLASQVTLAYFWWLATNEKSTKHIPNKKLMVMKPIVERFKHHQQNQIQDNYIDCYCISNFQARLFINGLSSYHPDVNTTSPRRSPNIGGYVAPEISFMRPFIGGFPKTQPKFLRLGLLVPKGNSFSNCQPSIFRAKPPGMFKTSQIIG